MSEYPLDTKYYIVRRTRSYRKEMLSCEHTKKFFINYRVRRQNLIKNFYLVSYNKLLKELKKKCFSVCTTRFAGVYKSERIYRYICGKRARKC